MVAGSDLEGEHVCGGVLMATRILIADDDSTIRLLLRRLLEAKQPDWQVCGEASNGVEAIEGVEQFEPDIVVMPCLGWMGTILGTVQKSQKCHHDRKAQK
jgi:AmiR/NasT family two-component response regulator